MKRHGSTIPVNPPEASRSEIQTYSQSEQKFIGITSDPASERTLNQPPWLRSFTVLGPAVFRPVQIKWDQSSYEHCEQLIVFGSR